MDSPKRQTATAVVTCFVVRGGRDGDEVLLVRRSERVRTYRGAWAGISGYLEPGVTPLDQAYTELREETALTPPEVSLVRAGAPVPVRDEANGLSWIVYPFLFRLREGASLATDWEATEHQWVRPGELVRLSTVPKLAEALAAVYPSTEPVG